MRISWPKIRPLIEKNHKTLLPRWTKLFLEPNGTGYLITLHFWREPKTMSCYKLQVSKLCNFNAKSGSKHNKDVSRLKSIMLQLKQNSAPIKI